MLSSSEIKSVKFSKAMSGYKSDEVDVFLDKIEADYAQFDRTVSEYQARIEKLQKEVEEYKEAQNSIQSVLVSAQVLADKIVNEAKEKSEEIIKNAEANISVITAHEKELSTTFEIKAQDRKNALEKELEEMTKKAQEKAEAITTAAQDAVKRQQMLFDKLKLEIAAFKSSITAKYKEHLESLSMIPDTVPSEPTYLASVVATALDKEPNISKYINKENILPSENDITFDAAELDLLKKTEPTTDISSVSDVKKAENFKIEIAQETEDE